MCTMTMLFVVYFKVFYSKSVNVCGPVRAYVGVWACVGVCGRVWVCVGVQVWVGVQCVHVVVYYACECADVTLVCTLRKKYLIILFTYLSILL